MFYDFEANSLNRRLLPRYGTSRNDAVLLSFIAFLIFSRAQSSISTGFGFYLLWFDVAKVDAPSLEESRTPPDPIL